MTRSATVSGGRGVTTGNGELVATWIGAVIWTVLSVPLVWAMTHDAELRSSPWAAFLWLFVAEGVLIWASAIRLTFGRLRFGRLTLEPDPLPGSLGGHVGGSVRVPLRHRVAADYRVTLSCVRSRRMRSRNGSSRSETVVWSAECVPVVEREGRSVRLRFTFDVPQHLPASEETSEDYHYWGVRVRGSVPGVDLDQAFRVQVERSDPPRLAARPAPRHEPSVHLERSGSAGVRVDRRPGHAIVEYRVGREWGTALGVTAFGVFFLAVPLGLLGTILGLGASGEGPDLLPILFAAPFVTVFGLVGLLLVVLGLYLLLNGLTVRLSASEVGGCAAPPLSPPDPPGAGRSGGGGRDEDPGPGGQRREGQSELQAGGTPERWRAPPAGRRDPRTGTGVRVGPRGHRDDRSSRERSAAQEAEGPGAVARPRASPSAPARAPRYQWRDPGSAVTPSAYLDPPAWSGICGRWRIIDG